MEEDNQQININIVIADRPYRLKIKPNEEENVRKAAKYLNEKISEFQRKYEGKDKQDYISMAALMYAVDYVNINGQHHQSDENVDRLLDEMDKMLSTQP